MVTRDRFRCLSYVSAVKEERQVFDNFRENKYL